MRPMVAAGVALRSSWAPEYDQVFRDGRIQNGQHSQRATAHLEDPGLLAANAVGILLVKIIRDGLESLLERQFQVLPADVLQGIRIEDMGHQFLLGQSLPNLSPHPKVWQGLP